MGDLVFAVLVFGLEGPGFMACRQKQPEKLVYCSLGCEYPWGFGDFLSFFLG